MAIGSVIAQAGRLAGKGFRQAPLRPVTKGAFGNQGLNPKNISPGKEGAPVITNEAPRSAPVVPKVDMDPAAQSARTAAAVDIRSDLSAHQGQEFGALQDLAAGKISDSRVEQPYAGFSKTESAGVSTVQGQGSGTEQPYAVLGTGSGVQTIQGQETGGIGQTPGVKIEQEHLASQGEALRGGEEEGVAVGRNVEPSLGSVDSSAGASPKVESWGSENQPYLKYETNPDISAAQASIEQRYQAKLAENPAAGTLTLSGLRDQAVSEAWNEFVKNNRHTAESFWGKNPFLDRALQKAAMEERKAAGQQASVDKPKQAFAAEEPGRSWFGRRLDALREATIPAINWETGKQPGPQMGEVQAQPDLSQAPRTEQAPAGGETQGAGFSQNVSSEASQGVGVASVVDHPDKVAAYAEKNPDIKAALERKAQKETQDTSVDQSKGEGAVDKQGAQAEQTPVEKQMQQMEEKIASLTAQNGQLQEQLTNVTKVLVEMGPLIKALVEKDAAKEPDPQKKEEADSFLKKLLMLIALLAVGSSGALKGVDSTGQ